MTASATDPWLLSHMWTSPSDRAALALCADQLAGYGVGFGDAHAPDAPNAVKLHGGEMVERLRHSPHSLADLRPLAVARQWQRRVDPRAWHYMFHDDKVTGIPIAIHRANMGWANSALAESIARSGAEQGATLWEWLTAAARQVPRPLAVGREPWQIGILFESLLVAADRATYRRIFVEEEHGLFDSRLVRQVLDRLKALSDFVDEARMALPWRAQLELVDRGAAALTLMGDWVRVAGAQCTRALDLADFRVCGLHVIDFFCPVSSTPYDLTARVADALTQPGFASRLAEVKGSEPALSGNPNGQVSMSLPSLTFEQCRGTAVTQTWLEVLADHFLSGRTSHRTARLLAAAAAG